jgi:NTP pyrophosphatase (non-canonical NTP hydrolase)
MNFSEYQQRAMETAVYPGQGTITGLEYTILGLVGEAGEIAQRLKKHMRDGGTEFTLQIDLQKELGDVLWYCAALASEIKNPLDIIAMTNLEKLQSRKERGTIKGSGDNR